jgi:hypothetical protein
MYRHCSRFVAVLKHSNLTTFSEHFISSQVITELTLSDLNKGTRFDDWFAGNEFTNSSYPFVGVTNVLWL